MIDTIGVKVAPLSTVDAFGTPHSKALHVVERYRLIDGQVAAEAQRKHGAINRPGQAFYGRGAIDADTAKTGLQVEFTVEDEGVFTTPWSGRVTYRRVIGDWPEAVCAENILFSAVYWLIASSNSRQRRISNGRMSENGGSEGPALPLVARRSPIIVVGLRGLVWVRSCAEGHGKLCIA